MPCWEVQTYSLVFKAKNKDLLIEAAMRIGLKVEDHGKYMTVYGSIVADIYLDEEKIVTTSYYTREVNRLKMEYSKVIVEKVAKLKKWALVNKNAQGTRMELKRF